MKKITSSIVAALAMCTFAVAGGDIAPVEPEVTVPEVVSTPGSFYVGLAYAYMKADADATGTVTSNSTGDYSSTSKEDWNAVMLQAGYQFNQYLAVEGRYWTNVGNGDGEKTSLEGDQPTPATESINNDITAWGIYLKPTLPVGESFNVYGLLGYGNVDYAALDDSSFQWGAGASYKLSENLSVFVDYVSLYDDSYADNYTVSIYDYVTDVDETVYAVNFGLTYTF